MLLLCQDELDELANIVLAIIETLLLKLFDLSIVENLQEIIDVHVEDFGGFGGNNSTATARSFALLAHFQPGDLIDELFVAKDLVHFDLFHLVLDLALHCVHFPAV